MASAKILSKLALDQCPHCGTSKPTLNQLGQYVTHDFQIITKMLWAIYSCTTCGKIVMAYGPNNNSNIIWDTFPKIFELDESIPAKASAYLKQGRDTIHAPAGSIMLSAAAVDAMLKSKGYNSGNLYQRIKKAREDHLITEDMERWAHQIRLEANDQRHADLDASLPSQAQAKLSLEFALALAEFLFVLPSRVTRGLEHSQAQATSEDNS